ncbi:hypothetical protein D1AOALGA4SA_8730 [Olavius algarvensis Delta 1 endosymbiont]|nr:hypothetical protein D1AOALGA4SA_8730 [Olavius algarvensis Delta 1 endosymbiont]
MYRNLLWSVVVMALVMAGCAKEQIYSSVPPLQTVSTSNYEVKLEPLKAEGYDYYNRFSYQFTNKTNGNLTIDWSETFYLRNGKRHGHFGWEGLTFEQLREVKEEPTITIGPGEKDSIEIFPVRLIGWKEEGVRLKATTPEAGFSLTPLPVGENGMSIAVFKDGKLLRKRILVTISLN